MTYLEDDLLPISALQHLAFCERQWGLIHLEQQWADNRLTAEGRALHDRTDRAESESRVDVRIARSLRLRSLQLGLTGISDVVEFHRCEQKSGSAGKECVQLAGCEEYWSIFPVEYKRGKPKLDRCDEVQLCAQALCLEEMLDATIAGGALFYGRPRRRTEVTFDTALRDETKRLATRLHELQDIGQTPTAVYSQKCKSCSLLDVCKPKSLNSRASASRYLSAQLRELLGDEHSKGAERA